jgi:hypothetical protein
MIVPKYTIQPSSIPNAGFGLFLAQAVTRGSIITAPDKINQLLTVAELERFDVNSIEVRSSTRWFENWCTSSPDWPDECYINHSFTPTALWHLGFTFAVADLPAETEITIDYRFFLLENETPGFSDAQTGQLIIGFSWQQSLMRSTTQLYQLMELIKK